ncbi:hypothetical protein C8J56DRAFT_944281 [Mycena floridula]|nr:hypothetical protein C8J56DRAFT_944281 [Mycena floridula]
MPLTTMMVTLGCFGSSFSQLFQKTLVSLFLLHYLAICLVSCSSAPTSSIGRRLDKRYIGRARCDITEETP